MITQAFTVAQAAVLGQGVDAPVYRLVLEFEVMLSVGELGEACWKNAGTEHILAAVFDHAPSAEEVSVAHERLLLATRAIEGMDYACVGEEVIAPGSLASYEEQQVSYARQWPEQFQPWDTIFLIKSFHSIDAALPTQQAPHLFARRLAETLQRSRAEADARDPIALDV